MTILVTGSNGYVGGSFIHLYKNQYNFKTFSLLTQNLEDINFKGVDVVLHCAALVHQKVEYSYQKYHEINVEYPFELAKLARKNGLKQFIFMSTVAVYGDDEQYLDENSICKPVTLYGKNKLEAEKELLGLSEKGQRNNDGFIVSIIRFPMVYGKDAPGNIDSLVKVIKKVPIIPLDGIKNRRSFVYIGNLCYLLDTVIEQHQSGILLASDDKPLSTTHLIELIAKELDKKIYLVKIPFFETLLKLVKPSFYKRLYGSLEIDNHLTKELLQLTNPYSVEEGIKNMIHGEKE
jgi:UDP-glucose 4-epimerase